MADQLRELLDRGFIERYANRRSGELLAVAHEPLHWPISQMAATMHVR